MVSGVRFSNYQTKSLQRSRRIQAMQKNLNQTELAESEGIPAIVNQVAIEVTREVVMVLRHTDERPLPAATGSMRELQRQICQTKPTKAFVQLEC